MRVLITGGSHTGALARAHEAGNTRGAHGFELQIRPLGGGITVARKFFESSGSRIIITNKRFRRNIAAIPFADVAFERVGFCTALYSRPIWYGRDWIRYAPPGVDDGRRAISRALLARLVTDDLKYLLQFLEALTALGLRPFVIDSPRPFRHNPEVARAGEHAIQVIDREYRRISLASLAAMQVPVVPASDDTFDEDGFTLPEFAHPSATDRTHANEAYGAKMLDRIYGFLGAAGERDTPQEASSPLISL